MLKLILPSNLPATNSKLLFMPEPQDTTVTVAHAFVHRSQKRTRRASATVRKRPRSLNRSVLVVDDVNDVTDMISLFLKHAGYQVMTAARAAEALQLAGERKFDLIISDIGMPEMNGYELVEALRHMPSYHDVPMIAVTGYTEYDDRGRSLQAGFNAHLTKPIEPARLLDLMSELLSGQN